MNDDDGRGCGFKFRMPIERRSVTHKFKIGDAKGYLTVGLTDDGMPGEIFITMAEQDSTERGFADAFAIAISFCLQAGIPLQYLVGKFRGMRFPPDGYTTHDDIKIAHSIVDYVFRWLKWRFLPHDDA